MIFAPMQFALAFHRDVVTGGAGGRLLPGARCRLPRSFCGAHRESRQQPLEIVALARWACRRVVVAHQRLEPVAARLALEVVDGHAAPPGGNPIATSSWWLAVPP